MSLLTMIPTMAQPATSTTFFPPRRRRVKQKSAQEQSLERLTESMQILEPLRGNYNPNYPTPTLKTQVRPVLSASEVALREALSTDTVVQEAKQAEGIDFDLGTPNLRGSDQRIVIPRTPQGGNEEGVIRSATPRQQRGVVIRSATPRQQRLRRSARIAQQGFGDRSSSDTYGGRGSLRFRAPSRRGD